jgi:hypothetical protein
VNGVPVANHGEDEQQKGDQQQAGCFRRVNCVPLMLAVGIVLALGVRHENIVRSGRKALACISFQVDHAELYSLRALQDAIFNGTNLTNRA